MRPGTDLADAATFPPDLMKPASLVAKEAKLDEMRRRQRAIAAEIDLIDQAGRVEALSGNEGRIDRLARRLQELTTERERLPARLARVHPPPSRFR